jgi:CDGSH-type Zn-finger protein/uncharacterized Fe-S cluster protein YjdI
MSNHLEVVVGKKIKIIFDAKKCIHSRGCVLSHPEVFVPNVEGEWIYPNAASPEVIAEIAHQCPSGAISYERLDGGPAEVQPQVNTVRLRENGPLSVNADIRIEGQTPRMRATLCRCGQSANKPFCDGAHALAAFVATGEVSPVVSAPLEKRNGALSIQLAPNGPLVFSGPLELVTGTGKTVNRVQSTALCRCGYSANKPYCDGSHAKVGFKS